MEEATIQAAELKVELVRDCARFEAIAKKWDELARHCETPLATHSWYLAAIDAQLPDISLAVVLIWQDDELAAAAPLQLTPGFGGSQLTPIDAFAGEPDRLLYLNEAALGRLAEAVADLGISLKLRRLPNQGKESSAMKDTLRGKFFVIRRNHSMGSSVPLSDGFDGIEQAMSGNRRSTIRRKWKAAGNSFGPATVECKVPQAADVGELLARFERIEGSGWKGREGTSIAADGRMKKFTSGLSQRFAETGNLRFVFLRFGDHDVAGRLILEWQHGWFEIKIGYDESYAKFSPGILLMHETLRHACDEGIVRYDFLGGYASWQDHWPREIRQYEFLSAYALRLSGIAAFISDAFNAQRKRLTS